ncbi:probable cytochrome P450 303a1 [Harpegnathos saltator]|uniref:Probable cytochrome P450 303a1 n=1 Tax=Harpegnathos saltator TaxID=610380 RepID=E2C7Z6_HARSA|nr:probable cytochrome P450 303a1 [Harpegnathos saltator]XP_011152300.1 probable cytochrome P450 303a1 [Harpegnathos saltator]XP_019700551.1 probable cytochrome P450 303a1 [Harpegnathos saltator]XP_025163548.1 probable cytochrome P450 303a1 [Harpegnathos saltator]EFN75914.1 Probable cytochrome P450 303a1 [Harpegnathos saltator]
MLATVMLLLVLLLLLLYLDCRKPKGYPPGPRWWPILGSILEVERLRQETKYITKSCAMLCKKYGPVIGLKFGQQRIVVLNDLESMHMMLSDENCDGRPNGPMFKIRTFGLRQGLILVDGRLWVEQRKFVMRHLRDFGFGRNTMDTIIQYEAQKLVEHFNKLLHGDYNEQLTNIRKSVVNDNNVGQIYKLQKVPNDLKKPGLYEQFNVIENKTIKKRASTAADLYVKAEDYVEVRKVAQSAGVIVFMHNAFGVTVLNTLWRMMAGKRYDINDKELAYLQKIFAKLLEEVDMIGAPFNHFPALRFIAPEMSGYKSFVETHQKLWTFLKEELYNHKNTFVASEPRDLMDAYLSVLQSKGHNDTFSEIQLLAICVDLFIAGSETTSKSLAFGFMYLILYPEVQRKAQEEIDRVVGRDRFPMLADRPSMPYLQATVLESVRMFIGRCLNVPRRTLRDTFIKGYRIPKDTMLVLNFNSIYMDESWGDPENFRPERFLDDDGNVFMPKNYYPFSAGRHRCMGETLAKRNIFLITAALLQAFNFSVAPGEPRPSSQDYTDGVTPSPIPYKALISPRT